MQPSATRGRTRASASSAPGGDQRDIGKIGPVSLGVARKQRPGFNAGLRADEEISQDIGAHSAGRAIAAKGLPGKPVVSLTPTAPALEPITDEYLEGMRQRRALRPSLGADSVTLVREMRDEER